MPPTVSDSTYEDNLDRLSYVDLDSPDTISIYASTFADKDAVADQIAAYNAGVAALLLLLQEKQEMKMFLPR